MIYVYKAPKSGWTVYRIGQGECKNMPKFRGTHRKKKQAAVYEWKNNSGTLRQLCKKYTFPVTYSGMIERIKAGMSFEQAATIPANEMQRTAIHKLQEARRAYLAQREIEKREYATKQVHPPQVRADHFGVCELCGAVLLKASLENLRCKGGC
jgi:hypothetical protein